MYYMLSMHFGYRGCEIWHQLLHTSFVESVDELGRPQYTIDQALIEKNYQQTGPNSTCRRTVKVVDDPENDVYLFSTVKCYISKLDKGQTKFLVKPKTDRQMKEDRDAPWFTKAPMGVHTIGQIMPRISTAAGTSKRYTNHCVRHTLGTNMMRMGFPLSAIQARLRLRSERTLAWYTAYRTADELAAENRTISEPLRGMPHPRQPALSAAAAEAGPSSGPGGIGADRSGISADRSGISADRSGTGPDRSGTGAGGSGTGADRSRAGAADENQLVLLSHPGVGDGAVPMMDVRVPRQLVPQRRGDAQPDRFPPSSAAAGPSSAAEIAVTAAANTGTPGQGEVNSGPFMGGGGCQPALRPWAQWQSPYVVPLHMADVRRPPPSPWQGSPWAPVPKVYSGVFNNCTFN